MPDYRARFLNDPDDDTGLPLDPCHREIEVAGAIDRKAAIKAAARRFERQEGAGDWRLRATSLECDRIR